MKVVDPHAPGGAKYFDRGSVKRKFDEMTAVRTNNVHFSISCTVFEEFRNYALSLSLSLFLPFSLPPSLSPSLPPPLPPSLFQDGDTGNFTLETAKSRLHLYLQQTRQPKDMQLRPTGPDNSRYIVHMCVTITLG